ncbi:MAG: DUF3276 family protein [Spirochaetaceae bacterium]|jgi:hypothetical protein|nr:DUF3276 family protein [Spirochaetaceae bacterium]
MGMRGELYTTKVVLENRAYFFNVKENRTGDVFLQIVESKSRNGEDFERRDIVLFADDMPEFFRGLDDALSFVDKDRKTRTKAKRIANPDHPRGFGGTAPPRSSAPPAIAGDGADVPKRTGRVHVVSKK